MSSKINSTADITEIGAKVIEINRLMRENPPQAIAYAKETWEIIRIKTPPLQQIPFLINFSNCLANFGKFNEAYEMTSLALTIKKRTGIKDIELATLLCATGDNLMNLERYEEAMVLLKKAQELFLSFNNVPHTIHAYIGLARCQDGLFNYIDAVDNLFRAEQLANAHKLSSFLISIALGFGNVYSSALELKKATKYYRKAATLSLKQKNMMQYTHALSNISKIYALTNKPELALKTILIILRIYEDRNDQYQISRTQLHLGIIYNQAKRPAEALLYLNKALKNKKANEEPNFYIRICLTLIETYFQMQNYRSAARYLNIIIPMVKNMNDYNLLVPTYNQGYNICKAQKKWKQALEYLDAAKQTENIIWNRDKEAQFFQLEQEFNKIKEQQRSEIFRLKNVELKKRNKLISEQKTQLESALDKLKSADDAKTKLFSIVAHDLRGPLASIYQGIELVLEEDSYQAEGNELLTHIQRSAFEVYSLTDNLLRWSAQQLDKIVVNPEPVLLEPLFQKIIEQHALIISAKHIEIIMDFQAKQTVMVDPGFMEVVFRNLLSNAIKFTPDSGVVKVELLRDNNFYVCNIKDSGQGIPIELQKHIFDGKLSVFSTGTGYGRGAGLGLPLVKEFVAQLGGTVSVSSSPGNGSVFSFTIPIK